MTSHKMRIVYIFSVFQTVMSNMQYMPAKTLPTQCHNEIMELSATHYISAVTNYSNCELKGQVGTVIQGLLSLGYASGVTVLSGTIVLDQMSLNEMGSGLHIKGDEIIVKDTNISMGSSLTMVGGRVSFERTQIQAYNFIFTNTSVTFSSTSANSGDGVVTVSRSSVDMVNSSIYVINNRPITFTASIVNLMNSKINLDHGCFTLQLSNATFTRSSVFIGAGTMGMSITNSSVVADCGLSSEYYGPVAAFEIYGGNDGPGVQVASSQLTFHKCSCDISGAIKVPHSQGSGISIDASSVHFEGCMASKEVRPIVV